MSKLNSQYKLVKWCLYFKELVFLVNFQVWSHLEFDNWMRYMMNLLRNLHLLLSLFLLSNLGFYNYIIWKKNTYLWFTHYPWLLILKSTLFYLFYSCFIWLILLFLFQLPLKSISLLSILYIRVLMNYSCIHLVIKYLFVLHLELNYQSWFLHRFFCCLFS